MAEKKDKAGSGIEKLTFEQSIKALTEIVSKVETGQVPLQESLDQYEKGMAVIAHCRRILQQAEKRIERISAEQGPEGGP
jgi:exodeoxyribonuclease VII small subunit